MSGCRATARVRISSPWICPGSCATSGNLLLSGAESFLAERKADVSNQPRPHVVMTYHHGPLYTAEYVAGLRASLLMLAREVVACANCAITTKAPCGPSLEGWRAAWEILGEEDAVVAS